MPPHYTMQRIMNSSQSPIALVRRLPAIPSSRRGASTTAVVGAVIVTALILLGGLYFLGLLNTGPAPTTSGGGPPPSSIFAGNVNLAASGYDYFNHATAYTPGTNFNVLFYTNVGGTYQLVATNSATANIPSSAGGTLYAEVQVPSGQNYYVDPTSTQNQNAYVTAKSWSPDLGGQTGHSYWVFTINLNSIPKPNLGNPTYDFYVVLSAYALPSLNSPAAITGLTVGTAATKFITWQASFSTTSVSFAITQIQISLNSTSLTDFVLNSVDNPAVGSLIPGSSFSIQRTAPSGAGTTFYTYNVGTDQALDSAEFLHYGPNQNNIFDFSTSFTITLSASTGHTGITITILGLNPAGSAVSVTNTVVVAGT
jgi:hypothetical protein